MTNPSGQLRRHLLPIKSYFASQRRSFLLRLVVIAAWGAIFIAIPRVPFVLYFVPCLALITFCLLSPFSIILAVLFLTAYINDSPVNGFSDPSVLLSTLLVWLAVTIALTARYLIRSPTEIRGEAISSDLPITLAPDQAASTSQTSISISVSTNANLRHDVRTPINMIVGFCEALLKPASPFREPLPAPYREDVEAILRNSKQLEHLINQVFDKHSPVDSIQQSTDTDSTSTRRTLILLDETGAALEMFSQYANQYAKHFDVIRVPNVEGLGRLKSELNPAAVIISGDDNPPVPVVTALVGSRIPVLTFNLSGESSSLTRRAPSTYLMKPVEIEALAAVLPQEGTPLRNVLVVDDNRDSVQMLNRMLSALAPSARIWKAYSGREALALLREQSPDVILLDFVLPDMDGMAILDYLRADSRLAHIPVILVSAHRPPDISDYSPLPGLNKLTLFRMAGFTPAQVVQYVEALFSNSERPE